MILAIAIISLIGVTISIFEYALVKGKFSSDTWLTIIAILSWWEISAPVSIILILLIILMMIINGVQTKKY